MTITHSHAEGAVSSVVAAVLLVALFVTAMSIFTFSTLPEWKADKEQVHQTRVKQEMSGLLSDLEALAARNQTGPVTARIPLTVAKIPLLQPTAAQGTLASVGTVQTKFTSAQKSFDVSSSRLAYQPMYQAYPNQALVFEAGAIVVDAGAPNQGVVAHPSFSLAVTSNGTGVLNWTIISLSSSNAVSGSRDAVIIATFQNLVTHKIQTAKTCSPCATFELTTPTSEGWSKFFQSEIFATKAQNSVTNSTATGKATLRLNSGPDLTQAVTQGWIINIRIINAEVKIT